MTAADVGAWGLSPRLRGNPRYRGVGESSIRRRRPRVYPRAYGETRRMTAADVSAWGLSPRLRGNLLDTAVLPRKLRRVYPRAYGVEPLNSPEQVYPRAYGETTAAAVPNEPQCAEGLSPRLRGNLLCTLSPGR